MPDDTKLPENGPNLASSTGGAIASGFSSVTHPASKEGVFTAMKKVITGKNLYETDKAEPALKLLEPKSINEAMAMSGMNPGVHQHTIRGDSVYHFLQNRLRFVDGNETLMVKGQQTEQITKNADFGYLADRTVAVGRDDSFTVKGHQDTYVLGPSTEQFVGQHEVTAPEEFEWKQLERGFSAFKLDLATLGLDIHAMAGDVHVVDAEATVFEGKGGTFKEIIEAQRMNLIALIIAGALELDIVLRGDTLIDLGTGTPFR